MSWRVLCDEYVPESTVADLGTLGVSATHVTENPGSGCSDEAVAAYARENDYVLLTDDDDFIDGSTHPDVQVLYYPDNVVPSHVFVDRVRMLRSWVSDPADLGRVTFLTG
jgi:predicted nuclease of predicted toxin-antitoxin system